MDYIAEPITAWQCEKCGEVYAEYVNGCPKCWHGYPTATQEPQMRSKVVVVQVEDKA